MRKWIGILMLCVSLLFVACTSDPINVEVVEANIQSITQTEEVIENGYFTEQAQEEIYNELERMKEDGEYTLDAPLFIWNPYGTTNTSLYVYFTTDEAVQVEYTISINGYEDFTRTLKNTSESGYSTVHEYLLMGFVADEEATITFNLKKENGKIVSASAFSLTVPPSGTEDGVKSFTKKEGNSQATLSDGLFFLLGREEQIQILCDNEGVIRGEFVTRTETEVLSNYNTVRIIPYEDCLIFGFGSMNKIGLMNNLGHYVKIYDLGEYVLHHDMMLNENGQLLILATNIEKDTKEDMVILLDMNSGEVSELIDSNTLFPEYLQLSESARAVSESADDWDWIHYNSIDIIGDQILLSARENSSIILISDIYGTPKVEYIIAEPDIWEGTSYTDLLLTKVGDFPSQWGQHSVIYMPDESLPDGQYYIYMYNNNCVFSRTRTDYTGNTPEQAGDFWEGTSSQYYRYLVDENNKTYELDFSFDVPYSSIMSNVHHYEGNIIVTSAFSNPVIGEYDQEGNLIAEYDFGKALIEGRIDYYVYRAFKVNENMFWFV